MFKHLELKIKASLNTVCYENLTVIKFHGLSKLLREKKLMDLKFYGIKFKLVTIQHNSKSYYKILILRLRQQP